MEIDPALAPDAPAEGSKRKHRPNPEHPRHPTSIPSRFAIVAAYIVASWLIAGSGWGAPQPGTHPETSVWPLSLDPMQQPPDEVVTLARSLLTTRLFIHGLGLADGWLPAHNEARTIITWWLHFVTHSALTDFHPPHLLVDHPIPTALLDLCIQDVVQHIYTDRIDCFTRSTTMQLVAKECACSLAYLWKRMKAHEPGLKWLVTIEPRLQFTEAQKAARVAYSKIMLVELGAGLLRYYIWIDQKKTWIRPGKKLRSWVVKREGTRTAKMEHHMVVETPLLGPDFKDWCTYVYVCVNEILGPFLIVKCTGTKGKDSGEPAHSEYKTMKGHWAKNPPAAEIKDVLRQAWGKVQAAMDAGLWPRDKEPTWSLDNAVVHKAAVSDWDVEGSWRKKEGIRGRVHMPPAYSPDLHQVVEHSIGQMSKLFKKQLLVDSINKVFDSVPDASLAGAGAGKPTLHDLFLKQQQCFYEANKGKQGLNAIAANVRRMHEVYTEVIRIDGAMPIKKFT